MALSREQFLAAASLPRKQYDLPEGKGSVWLQVVTAAERDAFEGWVRDTQAKHGNQGLKNFRARWVAKCLVDEQGVRLFADNQIEELGKLSAVLVEWLYERCNEINHIGSAAAVDQAVIDAAKNSASGQTEGSPTV